MFIPFIKQLLYFFFASSGRFPFPNDNTVPLIPRKELLGNPDKTSAELSPDGKIIAYLAPRDGVLNIWVQSIDELLNGRDTAKVVTFDKGRGILGYSWTYLKGVLVYAQDTDGDENYILYKLDVTNSTPLATAVTDSNGTKAEVLTTSYKYPEQMLIGLNNRDPSYFDIYRVNLTSGNKEMIFQNDRFADFVFDNDMKLRLGSSVNADGGVDYFRPNGTNWIPYKTVSFEDESSTYVEGFDKTNTKLYWLSSEGRNLNALFVTDFETPDVMNLVYAPSKSDIEYVIRHPTKKTILAIHEDYDYPSIHIMDDSIKNDWTYLSKLEPEGKAVLSETSLDMTTWLVVWYRDNGPSKYYIYDRIRGKATFLFATKASLLRYKHARMRAVEVDTRDGQKQLCYITIPVQADPKHTGQPLNPIPLVLRVHGGPWSRDSWGFGGEVQLFANRGYAVLQCNFRSSTGFGKDWVNAGNGEWGRKMHDDLLDGVQWAIDQKIADPDRIAIFGGSYGGYATLAALVFTPNRFACGVDIVGPSNLETLLKTLPSYWKPIYNSLVKRIGGDPQMEEGRAYLRTRSPVHFADKITKPLLIGQGANDPRVKQNESDQIVQAMKKHNVPVTYVLFPDEGHGFVRPENRLAFEGIIEQFLSSCLGGRVEPASEAVSESSAQILERGNLCIPTEKVNGLWVNPCI